MLFKINLLIQEMHDGRFMYLYRMESGVLRLTDNEQIIYEKELTRAGQLDVIFLDNLQVRIV